MRCDVLNVAPVKHLFLHWYKGNTLINTSVFDDPTVRPVNTSAAVTLLAHGDDDGSSIWCEAVMYFYWQGADSPTSRSQAYKMDVLCMFFTPSYLPNSVLGCRFFTRLVVFPSSLVSPQFLQPSPVVAQRRSWSFQMEARCFSIAQLGETRPRRTAGASQTPPS